MAPLCKGNERFGTQYVINMSVYLSVYIRVCVYIYSKCEDTHLRGYLSDLMNSFWILYI